MSRYLLRRLYLMVFVFLALSLFAFSLGYLFPGDVIQNLSGLRQIDEQQRQQLINYYQLTTAVTRNKIVVTRHT
jgi:ABC-type dipeptide/oligopeptide/nickel transport system permease component